MNPNDLKCRAKRLDNGEWVEGWYVSMLGCHEIFNDELNHSFNIHIDPATLQLLSEANEKVKPKEIMDYWNSKDTLPRVNAMSDTRKRHLSARCKEAQFVGGWKKIIDYIAGDEFYYSSGWCKIDLILKNNDSYGKVLEKITNLSRKKQPTQQAQSLSALERARMKG